MQSRFEQARINQLTSLYGPDDAPRLALDFGDYLSLLWRLDTCGEFPSRERYYRQCVQALGAALGFKTHPIFRMVEMTPAGQIYAQLPNLPYRGGGLALNDVMGGQVKFFFANGSSVVGQIKGGKVKAIAHTGKGRLASLPDIPPISDTLPGFEAYEWNGVFVPHGTPAAIVEKLNGALNAALKTPAVADRFAQLNIQSRPNTPAEFAAFVAHQMDVWGKVVKDANIHLG